MKRKALLPGLLVLCLGLYAQNDYEKRVYISTQGDSLNYRVLCPETIRKGEKYPLVLFMHGAGERGIDNHTQLTHGGQMFLNPVNREKYPAYVLFPQCPPEKYWGYFERPASFIPDEMPANPGITPLIKAVKELLDSYMALPDVDTSRVYIMGLSMGGMATFDMAVRFPETFAAAIPICGTINPLRLPPAKDINFRIFHGDRDDVVTVQGSREAYRALKAAGGKVEYIEFPCINHGSWEQAFNYPDFMEWLFRQSK